MKSIIQPYLNFGGRCEEALNFYKTALGAEIQFMMKFKESPHPPPPGQLPAGFGDKVMHSTFVIGGNTLMGTDGDVDGLKFNGFSLSLTLNTEADAKQAFDALADGGKVTMPLGPTFWSPCFGMLHDRFGLGWMIGLAGPNN